MRSRADICVHRGVVYVNENVSRFYKKLVSAIKARFFSLQVPFLSNAMPRISQPFMHQKLCYFLHISNLSLCKYCFITLVNSKFR